MIVNRVDSFSKQKQANTIKENMLAQQMFGDIRADEVAQEKKAKLAAIAQKNQPA